jgi:hypothetical protein
VLRPLRVQALQGSGIETHTLKILVLGGELVEMKRERVDRVVIG